MKKLTILEMNRLSVEEFKQTKKTEVVLILDNVRSALNVGSAFRTADAFLVKEIALCGITAKPPHREIMKTAIGATHTVDWNYYKQTKDAVTYYREQGYRLLAIEQAHDSIALQDLEIAMDEKIAVVFGNEVTGVDQEVMNMMDDCVEIPQFGTKHSLNISVCLGIITWELTKALRLG